MTMASLKKEFYWTRFIIIALFFMVIICDMLIHYDYNKFVDYREHLDHIEYMYNREKIMIEENILLIDQQSNARFNENKSNMALKVNKSEIIPSCIIGGKTH